MNLKGLRPFRRSHFGGLGNFASGCCNGPAAGGLLMERLAACRRLAARGLLPVACCRNLAPGGLLQEACCLPLAARSLLLCRKLVARGLLQDTCRQGNAAEVLLQYTAAIGPTPPPRSADAEFWPDTRVVSARLALFCATAQEGKIEGRKVQNSMRIR